MKTPAHTIALPFSQQMLLSSARQNLRRVLNHPAFTPERRQRAEQLMSATTTSGAQLIQWKILALRECEAWEEATLEKEARQLGPAATAYHY